MEVRNSVWGTEELRYYTLLLRQGSLSVVETDGLKVNHPQTETDLSPLATNDSVFQLLPSRSVGDPHVEKVALMIKSIFAHVIN